MCCISKIHDSLCIAEIYSFIHSFVALVYQGVENL